MKSVTVIGTGYVGLVVGTCLADFGFKVICMDSDRAKIRALEEGEVPIFEPGLLPLITQGVQSDHLSFTDDIVEAVARSQIIFIAVPTPPNRDGSADLHHVLAAAESIARTMSEYKIIVNKSTVPCGTGRMVKDVIRSVLKNRGRMIRFDFIANPEFLREGTAIWDFQHPDRIIIGGDDQTACEAVRDIYRSLYSHEVPFIITSLETAELVKYASNAFLATKISFINQIANLCEAVHADVRDTARAMGMDHRIGEHFLRAGPGFGGSCLPKDSRALVKVAQEQGVCMSVVKSALAANDFQSRRMVQKLESSFTDFRGKTFAALGLAFKQGTDDVRESPAIRVVSEIIKRGGCVKVFDPQAMENARKFRFNKVQNIQSRQGGQIGYGDFEPEPVGIIFCADEYDAAKDADAVLILTEWNQFRTLDLGRLARTMRDKNFFDFRNLYDPQEVTKFGFRYESVGSPKPAFSRSRRLRGARAASLACRMKRQRRQV
jgi:UDPglucose 6-dehydrogenase